MRREAESPSIEYGLSTGVAFIRCVYIGWGLELLYIGGHRSLKGWISAQTIPGRRPGNFPRVDHLGQGGLRQSTLKNVQVPYAKSVLAFPDGFGRGT